VIDGNTPARVTVEDRDSPTSTVIWNRQDALLLAGRCEGAAATALLAQIDAVFAPDVAHRHIPQFSLHYTVHRLDT
jgi:hypothetical protein